MRQFTRAGVAVVMWLAAALMGFAAARAPDPLCAELGGPWAEGVDFDQAAGHLGVRGTAGRIGFEGEAPRFKGCLLYPGDAAASALVLVVSAPDLTTGRRLQDSHMSRALRAEEFPVIRYEYGKGGLRPLRASPAGAPDGWRPARIEGILELSGRRQPQPVQVRWRQESDRLQVEGEATLSLTRYGIRRPRFLWVQVDDPVQVVFSLQIALP